VKLTKNKLKQIIKEELENMKEMDMEKPNPVAGMSICDDLVSRGVSIPETFNYADMSDEQLVLAMCTAEHYKPFYFIAMELHKRGYKGPMPEQEDNFAFRKKMKAE
jgi:hypothetical protein